ncbi:MAG: hypothetical protein SGBAC_000883 [Bacillariaceae sp.]
MTVDSSKIEDKEASQALEEVVDLSANAEEDEFSEINFSPASVRRKPKRPSMFVASESFLDDSQPHLNEVSYHPGNTPFYSPPKQRQRWGDKRVLPRVNWGDLFFDLFFVAATYNISTILVTDPSATGFLYFMATFMSSMNLWSAKTFFDSTFAVDDDIVHRVMEVCFLTAMGSVIVHIRTADILSHPADYVDMFALSLSLLLAQFITLLRQIEIGITGIGEEGVLKMVSFRNSRDVMIFGSTQLAATIIAGLDYYNNAGGSYEDGSHRMLAGGGGGSTNHIPIILTLAGPVIFQIQWTIRGIFLFPSDGSHTKLIVPINVDFTIHRQMEWTMLMLGESVFSLLVEEVTEVEEFYVTFYCGLLCVILLVYIHFTSQPMVAERHVMVDSKNRAIVAGTVQNLYSASMVGLGAGLTLFLRSFAKAISNKRRLVEFAFEGRFLASGGAALYSTDEMNERSAVVFCLSLGMVLLCVDILQFLQFGFRRSFRLLARSSVNLRVGIVFFCSMRWVLIVFLFTLWIWTTSPEILAEIGVGCALIYSMLVLVTRKLTKEKEAEHNH